MTLQTLKNIIILLLIIILAYLLNLGCPIHHIFGVYCPGCGITRMFISIFQLQFYQAFRYNPLVFIYLIGYLIYFIIKVILKKVFNKDVKIPNTILYILIIIAILFGILRNIDSFNWLAPTIIN